MSSGMKLVECGHTRLLVLSQQSNPTHGVHQTTTMFSQEVINSNVALDARLFHDIGGLGASRYQDSKRVGVDSHRLEEKQEASLLHGHVSHKRERALMHVGDLWGPGANTVLARERRVVAANSVTRPSVFQSPAGFFFSTSSLDCLFWWQRGGLRRGALGSRRSSVAVVAVR